MNFSLTQLQYLVAVDQTKQFSLAAKVCNISQPTLSHQIQKIEEELDTIIFDRSKKPILNTDIGQKIIDQAKNILREAHRIQDIIHESSNITTGSLKIGIIPTISPYLVPLFLDKFIHKYPQVELKVQENTTDEIINLLMQDKLDAGILATPLYDDRLIESYLYNEPLHIYSSNDHPLSDNKYINHKKLTPEGLWIMADGHCLRNQVLNLCSIDLRKVKFESGNIETIIRLVDKIGGYTLIPEMAVMELTSSQKAKVRTFNTPLPTREVSIVYSRIYHKENLIQRLSECIIDRLPKEITSLKKKVSIVDIH